MGRWARRMALHGTRNGLDGCDPSRTGLRRHVTTVFIDRDFGRLSNWHWPGGGEHLSRETEARRTFREGSSSTPAGS